MGLMGGYGAAGPPGLLWGCVSMGRCVYGAVSLGLCVYGAAGRCCGALCGGPTFTPPPLHFVGSPFRDEITLAILQLQENNRLEILKRKWWEGGRCPKEEDRRAKGGGGAPWGPLGGVMGPLWGCYGAVGLHWLPWGCYGAVMGPLWGCYGAVGPHWDPMGPL